MRRSPRNLNFACNHASLTHFGGVYFLQQFIRVLQLRDFLARHLAYPRVNSDYSVSQMLLALIDPIILGLDRIHRASLLRSTGTFQYLTGLQSFPDPQTLRRFLLNAPAYLREQLHPPMIDCSKGWFTCRSTARVSSSISTAPCSPYSVIKKGLRWATIPAIAASDPMTRCSAWKPTPRPARLSRDTVATRRAEEPVATTCSGRRRRRRRSHCPLRRTAQSGR